MTPEERARQQIDLLLQQSGWIVQDRVSRSVKLHCGVVCGSGEGFIGSYKDLLGRYPE